MTRSPRAVSPAAVASSRVTALSRLVEAVIEATFVLVLVLGAAGRGWFDARIAAVALGAFVVLTAAVYAFHAITFDEFRLTPTTTDRHHR
jgi:hypothetical protein